jgi:adenosylmethionine-8-amino-7-oxononanoate aminotransferase
LDLAKQLQKNDLAVNWHPCMQMKDFANHPPLAIKFAKNEFLIDFQGNSYIDATSSWWCKTLGHNQPQLQQAMIEQMYKFEHVIFANTTNNKIVELSAKLLKLIPHCNRVNYASDGSCAVEIAVKMSLQANQILGNKRSKLASLSGGYHGETILTLALSDCKLYSKPFENLLPAVNLIHNIPYVSGIKDSLWKSSNIDEVIEQLNPIANELSCIVLEPIVQGACGMQIYSADFLHKLATWAKSQNIHLIVDEIMTGFGRTGKMFAFEHANIQPDFICLGKGLTAGMLPMSAVVTTEDVYEIFYDDYSTGKAFMHSHTHTGNALAAAVACAALDVYNDINVVNKAKKLNDELYNKMYSVLIKTEMIENIRSIGGIVAADIINNNQRKAFKVCMEAIKHGVLMRPLGKVIYWLPPLNIEYASLDKLAEATIQSLLKFK